MTAPLANPFGRGYLRRIGWIHQSHAIGGANGSAMVVMFVDCCVGGGPYCTIPTVGILWSGSFLFPREPYSGQAVKSAKGPTNTIQPWWPMLHQAPLPPRWTNLLLVCLPSMHAHRMGTWNVPIRPLWTEIWGGTVVGFWVVLGLGDIWHVIS